MRPNQAISPITALHPNHHSPIQMVFKIQSVIACLILTVGLGASNHCQTAAADDDQPTYENSAVPLFQKYCNSCHNADDMEGDLALDSPSGIAAGGGSGPALLPGDPKTSRMIRMITGQHDLKMPPDDADGPTQTEIEKLMAWIEGGAIVSNDISLAPKTLTVPEVNSKVVVNPITDVCWSPDGKLLAIARYQSIEVLSAVDKKTLFVFSDHPGKVNSIQFSPDSNSILAATGVTGLYGVAIQWDLATQKKINEFKDHRDVLYAAIFSPNGAIIATGGYDRKINLWDSKSGKKIRQLQGHNGAIYDLSFHNAGNVLASASGDQTVKLWNVKSGERLDTLGQPLREQFVTSFHPKLDLIVAAGRDNRIRSWKFTSKEKSSINPLLISNFAHEASIIAMDFSDDGKLLVTSAEDQTLKLWRGDTIELIASFPKQPAIAFALDISSDNVLAVGRLDGSNDFYPLEELTNRLSGGLPSTESDFVEPKFATRPFALRSLNEAEPNDLFSNAQPVEIPASIAGVFKTTDVDSNNGDADIYKVSMKKGETWVIETDAARSKSMADTKVEVLAANGKSIPRVLLQAVRDSYFTFRGKDANTSDDFRIFNWQEMELNELLFCNGEVVQLYLYPRGPDSGFKVYPGFGSRHNLFDTTPIAHALQEPCYIVKALPPGTPLVPNGLPSFELNYENDDDAKRILGRDSKLFFTAPEDGEYLVRVCDARNFQGDKFTYKLSIRPAQPDFKVSFSGKKMNIRKGSGQEFQVSATRMDDFSGPIDLRFENVPKGFEIPEKIRIQSKHFQAFGTVHAAPDAVAPTAEQLKAIKITAVAMINGKEVQRSVGGFEEMKIADSPKVQIRITESGKELTKEDIDGLFATDAKPYVLDIAPGETVSAQIVVKRNKHNGDIDFGKEVSGRNLPHGVFVDNIGLNGLRIIKGQGDAREFFVTAAKWVPEQTRMFHLRANNVDGETTLPVKLVVRKK